MRARGLAPIVFAASLLSVATQAEAAGKCEDDHLLAQKERAKGALGAAAEALERCSDRSCPNLVQADCTTWLEEVRKDRPSIVLEAKRADGGATVAARATLDDGAPLTLDGRAIDVDPGEHAVRFEADGLAPVTVRFVARAGAKNTPVVGTFETIPQTAGLDTPRIAAIALMAGGGAALLAFGALAIAGELEYQDLDDTCAPRCDPDDVSSVRAKFVAADVLLGVGLAAAGTGLIVFFAVPRAKTASAFVVRPTPSGAAAELTFSF